MKNTLFRRFELAISLLRTLSQVSNARSRLIRSEIRGSDSSLLLRLGLVDERRLRPVLIPIGSRRRAMRQSTAASKSSSCLPWGHE